jgi:hypothetical protein
LGRLFHQALAGGPFFDFSDAYVCMIAWLFWQRERRGVRLSLFFAVRAGLIEVMV